MPESISQLLILMQSHGATRFYAKRLSPNDNSKNQVYLGGDFSALNIIPYMEIYSDDSCAADSKRDRLKADVSFFWVDETGKHKAPNTQLILYPKYPEVRMSGFLKGCSKAPSDVMRVRDEGRVLFLGVTPHGDVLGFAVNQHDPLSHELLSRTEWVSIGVFIEIPPDVDARLDTRELLLQALKRIHDKQWITSQKMRADGKIEAYKARNGGGYTLEAELGVPPNSYAEPDFLGWEIKQYGVKNFDTYRPKNPVTLMTPEPTGGIYKDSGLPFFLNKFGYPDQLGRDDRINFGGRYLCNGEFHNRTGLRLVLHGFDATNGKITTMDGGIALVSRDDEIAALWNYAGMMKHWNHKHSQAAYVPSVFRTPPPEYSYGAKILLCMRTDFTLFLRAVSAGQIYYDPGIKIEGVSTTSPKIKRRSQFRISHNHLSTIYHESKTIDLTSIES